MVSILFLLYLSFLEDKVYLVETKENGYILILIYSALLILHNPIMPIYLGSKGLWNLVDLFIAGLLIFTTVSIRRKVGNLKKYTKTKKKGE